MNFSLKTTLIDDTNLTIDILKIGQELYKELMPFQHPLYILFLTQKKKKKLRLKFNVPSNISAFIDSRTLLIMDYQSYFKQNNTKPLFHPKRQIVPALPKQYVKQLMSDGGIKGSCVILFKI